jgi:1-acyl-sn-glycerol-3-phosphate acyltransferase
VQYQLSRIVAGPFLYTLGRPKVIGAEHVPASGGAILAANHQSMLDSIFLPLVLDRPVTFSAKAEYFSASGPAARLWAWYLKHTNQLRMDREGARAAQDTLEAALALLQEGTGRQAVPRPGRRRLARAQVRPAGPAGRADRHPAGAAPGPRGAAAGPDRDQDRRAAEVRPRDHRTPGG